MRGNFRNSTLSKYKVEKETQQKKNKYKSINKRKETPRRSKTVSTPLQCADNSKIFPAAFIRTRNLSLIAQSVERLATGWTVRGSNPDGGEIFRTRPDRPWGSLCLLYDRIAVLSSGGKAAGAWP